MKELKNKIVCADSSTYLPQLPDKSIDLILTIPPYNFMNYDNTDDNKSWKSISSHCSKFLMSVLGRYDVPFFITKKNMGERYD